MALLTAGYWSTTYWPSRYWEPNYWPKYGVPPAAPVPTGTTRFATWPPIRTKEELLPREKPAVTVIPQPLLDGMTFEEMVQYVHEMLAPLEATEEDFKRILLDLLPYKQIGEDDKLQPLKELLSGWRTDPELFENGLRKILKTREKN